SSGVNAMTKSQQVLDGMSHLGFPTHTAPIVGAIALVASILYMVPRTAVLGAILLTGYLGGAVASHLRVGDPTYFAVIFGVVVWGGLYLRDSRVRDLIPFRRRVHVLPNESA
ncbi:MAG: DoxX family protein, partial [Fibrella sp.]|nr:DoxX family protein [Armatimonadota bacterium]